MKRQIRLSGSGGQGVITAAIIFAEAAVAEGMEAVQSQSYGPEARGGAAKSEVIIDDRAIFHPHVEQPDLVLAMTQQAADKYSPDLSKDGTLLLDDDLVPETPDFPNVVRLPLTRLAAEKVGQALTANIVALGAVARLTGLVSFKAAKRALSHRVPPQTLAKNSQALKLGWDAASDYIGENMYAKVS